MTIKRYEHQSLGPGSGMDEDPTGEYVRFEDVEQVIERHRREWEREKHWDHEDALSKVLSELRGEEAQSSPPPYFFC